MMRPTASLRAQQLLHYRHLPQAFFSSYVDGRRQRELFDGVAAFCLFVGHSRSGSSLVGSLLSAHPSIVISHELDALRYAQLGFRRHQLFQLILERDAEFSASNQVTKSGYRYEVPGLWQGRFAKLTVVGDKKAGNTANRIRRYPGLLDRLRAATGLPLRIIYLARNPYDTITTMASKSGKGLGPAAARFVEQCETVQHLHETVSTDELLALRYEAVVAEPRVCLERLCRFLGVDAGNDYLDVCSSMVRPSPGLRRHEADWDRARIYELAGQLRRFPLLARYSFDE
jgi:hypothetical protein